MCWIEIRNFRLQERPENRTVRRVRQIGFSVTDVSRVIALAVRYGGRQEGEVVAIADSAQGAIRDPDGNAIELSSK